jgi:hypothetical protein
VCRSGQRCGADTEEAAEVRNAPTPYVQLQVLLNSYLQPLVTGCASR